MPSLFSKKYTASIQINAPREKVWKTLDDLENYKQWNSFTVTIATDKIIGKKVKLTVLMKLDKKPIIQTEYLLQYEEPVIMTWGMNWGPFLRARRIQNLREIAPSTTEYFTEDKIWGIFSPLVHWLYGNDIQAGFTRMATELKRFCEKA